MGLSPGVPGRWPNEVAGLQAGWGQREMPASGKARKHMQFNFLKYIFQREG